MTGGDANFKTARMIRSLIPFTPYLSRAKRYLGLAPIRCLLPANLSCIPHTSLRICANQVSFRFLNQARTRLTRYLR